MTTFNFEAIGTMWTIDLSDPIPEKDEKDLLDSIKKRIEQFDKTYSRFRKDSLVTDIAKQPGSYALPADAKPLIDLYEKLYDLTNGALTPLIGDTLSNAGYDKNYSLKTGTLSQPDSWESVLNYKYPKLIVKKTVLLDFGAAGKGYLTDIIGKLLDDFGIGNYCIDASGDILYKDTLHRPLRIGLEHPENSQQVIGVVEIREGSLCGSAGNRRKWKNFHHILNPHTLTSPRYFKAVWVKAKTGLLADALATCLFFTDASKLQQKYSFEYVIVNEDYTLQKSADFPGKFFYN